MGATNLQSTQGKRGIRCGWCLNGQHESCSVVIDLNNYESPNPRLWHCSCNCNTTGEYTPERPRTRCLTCGRRGVETGVHSRCVNTVECQKAVENRRAKNPQWCPEPKDTPKNTPQEHPGGKTNQHQHQHRCRCCNEPTKGGQFLPGHDARYISQQAKLIVEQNRQDLLAARLDDLSPSMFAKLTKRVETLRKETTR